MGERFCMEVQTGLGSVLISGLGKDEFDFVNRDARANMIPQLRCGVARLN
jgi:hypothetical protein